jgi:leucyl/phenylalanyl-tRNA--protein transferase
MFGPFLLNNTPPDSPFPNPSYSLEEPNGLLAIGGDLDPQRLLNAYRNGIFPWYNEDQPILWWSPNPRLVLYPEEIYLSRSLKKTIRKNTFVITLDHAFDQVIEGCSEPRKKEEGTWLSTDMKQAYQLLHKVGYAHSIEAWQNDKLVGGLYGIAIGKVFFGESMFSRKNNASKVAFAIFVEQLTQWGFRLIDCQVETEHLARFGARNISRDQFLQHLNTWCIEANPQQWRRVISDKQRTF